jgi:hypothetical protein
MEKGGGGCVDLTTPTTAVNEQEEQGCETKKCLYFPLLEVEHRYLSAKSSPVDIPREAKLVGLKLHELTGHFVFSQCDPRLG